MKFISLFTRYANLAQRHARRLRRRAMIAQAKRPTPGFAPGPISRLGLADWGRVKLSVANAARSTVSAECEPLASAHHSSSPRARAKPTIRRSPPPSVLAPAWRPEAAAFTAAPRPANDADRAGSPWTSAWTDAFEACARVQAANLRVWTLAWST